MVIYNPTDGEISVIIKGVTYTVGAKQEISGVPPEAAKYWLEKLHKFIVVRNEGSVSARDIPTKTEEIVSKDEETKADASIKKVTKK